MSAWNIGTGWVGFCRLWFEIGVHAGVYGWAPHFKRTASFLSAGGFMSQARPEDFEP